MRTELIIEGNAVYEIDFECMEKKNLAGEEPHFAHEKIPENAENKQAGAGDGHDKTKRGSIR